MFLLLELLVVDLLVLVLFQEVHHHHFELNALRFFLLFSGNLWSDSLGVKFTSFEAFSVMGLF